MGYEIDIRIDRERKSFHPGETVSGTVRISCENEWSALYADVMLFWRTEGKGDRDDGVAGRLELAEKGSTAPRVLEKTFSFQLPDMPWTYHGKALKIHWLIGVYVKPRGEDESARELPLIVHPSPETIKVPPPS